MKNLIIVTVVLLCTATFSLKANDLCDAALPITCSETVSGSTSAATFDDVGFCGTGNSSPGVWYTYTATADQLLTFSTCSQANFDTRISVFSGSCAALFCEDGNDDGSGCSGFTSSIDISGSTGTTYFILVHGFGSDTGDFDLTLTCGTPPGGGDKDFCADAEAIDCGQTVSGSTSGATFDAVGTCGTTNSAPGVWYTYTATADVLLTFSTCNQASYDTKISVFSGTCGTLVCEGGNDDGSGCSGFTSSIDIAGSTGTTYYILIHGFSSSTGDFDLTLTCGTPPVPGTHDVCSDAAPIDCGETLSGSTSAATFDAVGTCGTSNTAPGIWYSYTAATAGGVLVSTCNQANYDTKISVFDGTCPSLNCVGGNDDGTGCGLTSSFNFSASAGTTYYILVHGFGSATGDFDLSITCTDPATNDLPCDATPLTFGTPVDYDGTTATADPGEVTPGPGTVPGSSCNSTDGWCSFETAIQNSLWFTFVAPPSGCVALSAGPADYQLAVWLVTDCDDYSTYTEVAANDDGGSLFDPLLDPLSCLIPGETYYVQVDGFNGEDAPSSILVTDCGTLPLSCDAGGCQTRFTGYAPLDTLNHLSATGVEGIPPYNYAWSGVGIVTNPDKQTISVDPAVTTTYDVVVTDAAGCSVTCSVTVNVIDISCGKKGDKVQICHSPPGNSGNAGEMCVSPNALGSHMASHSEDRFGPCDNGCFDSNPPPAPCYSWDMWLTTDQWGGETGLVITDVTDNIVVATLPFFSLASNTQYHLFLEDCLDADHCYEVEVLDLFGDGICCVWGDGNYFYTYGGDTTWSPTGGAFGASETTSFGACAPGKRAPRTTTPLVAKTASTLIAYPNPFDTYTTIEFTAELDGRALLEIMDMSGRILEVLYDGTVTTGEVIRSKFVADDNPAGIYVYRLTLEDKVSYSKVTLTR